MTDPGGSPEPTGEAEPPAGGRASRDYLWPMLALVAGAVALLEYEYSLNPIPPGVDPGHWVAVSFAYVGLPYPPAEAVGSPWVDPPLLYPFLGGLVRLLGSPLSADFVLGGLLLGLFGLSVIHVARRYLATGPVQLAFVAAAIFNGATLTMLFWGGYPNFLGLILLNEAMVLLLLFLVRGRLVDGVLFYGAVAAIFLTHTLTFTVTLGALGAAAVLAIGTRQISPRFLVRWPNLAGAALLVGVVGAYEETIRRLHIVTPGYISSNPAAFYLNGIGQVFNPLTVNCACPQDNLPIWMAEFILLLVGLAVVVGTLLARNARIASLKRGSPDAPPTSSDEPRPRLVNRPLLLAAAWTAGACLVPALGALAHVDTDYPRFGYFLAVPILLLLFVVAERFALPWLTRALSNEPAVPEKTVEDAEPAWWSEDSPPPEPPKRPTESPAALPPPRAHRPGWTVAHVVSAIVVVLFLLGSGIPVAVYSENAYAGNTHDQLFLDAMHWLVQNDTKGSVLVAGGGARWVQALTARGSYDYGPTWVLFYPWQIVNAQQSYLALNSQFSINNNAVGFLYTGTQTLAIQSNPELFAFNQGVIFPILRVAPGSLYVTATVNNATHRYAPGSWGPPTVSAPAGGDNRTGEVAYGGPVFHLTQTDQLGSGGRAWMNFSAAPQPGQLVNNFQFALSAPAGQDPVVHSTVPSNLSASPAGFSWGATARLGGLPGAATLNASGTFTPNATGAVGYPSSNPSQFNFTVNSSDPSQPLDFSVELDVPGASNPAITLPPTLATATFLADRNIHFLLLPVQGRASLTATFYEAAFGFVPVFQNAEWEILAG